MNGPFHLFYPTEYVSGIAEITPEWLSARGAKGVVFDIDNTVVPQDAPADEAARRYFERLHAAGIKTFVVSNNAEPRVKAFAEAVGCGYCHKAKKPSRRGYLAAIRGMPQAQRSGRRGRPALYGYLGREPFPHPERARRTGRTEKGHGRRTPQTAFREDRFWLLEKTPKK